MFLVFLTAVQPQSIIRPTTSMHRSQQGDLFMKLLPFLWRHFCKLWSASSVLTEWIFNTCSDVQWQNFWLQTNKHYVIHFPRTVNNSRYFTVPLHASVSVYFMIIWPWQYITHQHFFCRWNHVLSYSPPPSIVLSVWWRSLPWSHSQKTVGQINTR